MLFTYFNIIVYCSPTNWEIHLRRLIRRKWSQGPFVEKENPFAEDKSFQELTLRSKVEVLYCFCLYRLDNNDITEVMKVIMQILFH